MLRGPHAYDTISFIPTVKIENVGTEVITDYRLERPTRRFGPQSGQYGKESGLFSIKPSSIKSY